MCIDKTFSKSILTNELGNTYIGWNSQTLSIGQSKKFVVIQDRVQILNPIRVHISVEYDPLAFARLASHVVNNLTQDVSEKTVSPLTSVGVKASIQIILYAKIKTM